MADVPAESIDLPPGFRFHPTDEEIITHYLSPKVLNHSFSSLAIGEVDLNKCEPWDLPSKAKMGEKEWYFFCQRDRKYPTGMRTNRATEAGYWKATGKDKEIYRGRGVVLAGMKKTLVFYRGRAPKGEKTNWVMHEFRLEGKTTPHPKPSKDEWVVCRVFHKSMGDKKSPMPPGPLPRMSSFGEDLLDYSSTLPPLMDPLYTTGGGADQGFDLKGMMMMIPPNSTSMLSYFSNMKGMENPLDNNMSFMPGNHQAVGSSTMFYPPIRPPMPCAPLPGPAGNSGYLHQEQAMLRAQMGAATAHCKVEQLSNQSIVSVSQDTGLSTDRNTEISSGVSKHEIGSFGEFDDPSPAAPPIMDLESMWNY